MKNNKENKDILNINLKNYLFKDFVDEKYKNIINFSLLIIILFLSITIGKRYYFNEFYYKVPNLTGLSYDEAKKIIKKSDLKIREMGEIYSDEEFGNVAAQEPNDEKIVKKNRHIKIWKSKGKPSVYINELTGINYVDALTELQNNGMKIKEIKKINSEYPINTVVASSPKTGEPIDKGSEISLIISTGINK